MVRNETPDTGSWRYLYDAAGQLVGTSDARGCGENFAYDTGGRLVAEDDSPYRAANWGAHDNAVDDRWVEKHGDPPP